MRLYTARQLAERETKFEAYYTPGPVAEQGLRGMLLRFRLSPRTMIDLCAGAGVFGQRAALVWPECRRVGVEIREEMSPAARHYDRLHLGDFEDPLDESADLVVSNPPFSRTADVLERALRLLRPGGYALLFVRQSWGYSDADYTHLLHRPPLHEWGIPGRCNLKRGYGKTGRKLNGDNNGHKWLIWRRGLASTVCSWTSFPMPALPSTYTRWEAVPGTEPTVEPLEPEFWPLAA